MVLRGMLKINDKKFKKLYMVQYTGPLNSMNYLWFNIVGVTFNELYMVQYTGG